MLDDQLLGNLRSDDPAVRFDALVEMHDATYHLARQAVVAFVAAYAPKLRSVGYDRDTEIDDEGYPYTTLNSITATDDAGREWPLPIEDEGFEDVWPDHLPDRDDDTTATWPADQLAPALGLDPTRLDTLVSLFQTCGYRDLAMAFVFPGPERGKAD